MDESIVPRHSTAHAGAKAAFRGRPSLRRLTFGLLILGVIWRFHRYAMGVPIWGDEAFVAINFAMRDFAGMVDPLIYGQICPLFFMWAQEAVSRVFGLSEWSLHLLPFLAGIAGLLLFVRFARATLPLTASFCAIGIFAGSYFITRHSAEVKPYSLDLLVSVALSGLGWSVFINPRSIGRWIGLIVLAAAAPWSSYPSMFVGGAVGLLLTCGLMQRRWAAGFVIGWAVFGVVLCGSAYWMYTVYGKPHADASSGIFELESWSSTFPPISEPWRLPVWFIVAHTGNLFAYPQGGAAPGSLGTFALFVVGCVRLWKKNSALLLLLLTPFALNFVAAAMRAYPYGGSARVAQHLAPAICLLSGLGLSVILRRFLRGVHLRRAWLIAAVLLALIPLGDIIDITRDPYKSDKNCRRHHSVLWAAEKTQPGDQWVIFNSLEKVAYAPWMGDWRGVGSEFIFNVMRFAPVPVQWSPPPDTVSPPPNGRLFVVVYYTVYTDKVDFPKDQLDSYLKTIESRSGPSTHESYLIRDERRVLERVDLYRFDSTAD